MPFELAKQRDSIDCLSWSIEFNLMFMTSFEFVFEDSAAMIETVKKLIELREERRTSGEISYF